MDRLATLAGVLLSLLLIAWLVRVPVTEQDYRPTPPVATADPIPRPTPSSDPIDPEPPTAGLEFTVQPVDAVSLEPLTEAPVATIGPWSSAIAGPDQLLIEHQTGTDGRFDRLRRLDPPTAAASWPSDPLGQADHLTWVGGTEDTTAWASADGRIRIRQPGASGAHRTLFLPDARRVRDASFVPGGLLVMLMGNGSQLPPSVLVIDVAQATLVADVTVDVPVPASRLRWAWDVEGQRLYLMDGELGLLTAVRLDVLVGVGRPALDPRADLDDTVDLGGFALPLTDAGALRTVNVVSDLGLPPSPRGFGISAAGGLVVVHGLLEGHRGDEEDLAGRAEGGLVLLDADLTLLRQRDDLTVESALVSASTRRTLVAVRDGGLHVLDDRLEHIGDVLMHGPSFALLGTRDGQAYVMMQTGSLARGWLASVNMAAGKIVALRQMGSMQTFLPTAGLLISPA